MRQRIVAMFQVTHGCPKCGHTELAPLVGVFQGDAGIWVCGACETAFEIEVRFQPLKLDYQARTDGMEEVPTRPLFLGEAAERNRVKK